MTLTMTPLERRRLNDFFAEAERALDADDMFALKRAADSATRIILRAEGYTDPQIDAQFAATAAEVQGMVREGRIEELLRGMPQ